MGLSSLARRHDDVDSAGGERTRAPDPVKGRSRDAASRAVETPAPILTILPGARLIALGRPLPVAASLIHLDFASPPPGASWSILGSRADLGRLGNLFEQSGDLSAPGTRLRATPSSKGSPEKPAPRRSHQPQDRLSGEALRQAGTRSLSLLGDQVLRWRLLHSTET